MQGAFYINVRGTVQGVGFRPYVYGLATAMGLRGYVTNTSDGVLVVVEGEGAEDFAAKLSRTPPPLARIMQINVEIVEPQGFDDGFEIRPSQPGESFTLISADISTCNDCLRELLDPADRRFGYPFINCTNCGPRYTITEGVPYDRPNTTMARFTMCTRCQAEYDDPADRRFHAVPNACADCGPSVELYINNARQDTENPVLEAARLMQAGSILALKGLGGFHLACDALNADTVSRMRRLKRKGGGKPFALMARDMDIIRQYCHVTELDEELLDSPKRPVVLLRKKSGQNLPHDIAPANKYVGFMLPYTPLHTLILQEVPLAVMTSGNRAEEPIAVDNADTFSDIADAVLLHDRDIFMRVDDSVVRVVHERGSICFMRRARGFAPEPIPLGSVTGPGDTTSNIPDMIAAGADLKNTFTLIKGDYAIVSQHIGDMDNYETLGFYKETLDNLCKVYSAKPVALAHDMHPGYASTRWAQQRPEAIKLPVQHHYAHIASVMAEKTLDDTVIGVSLDGTGYGDDGTIWGGEFLLAHLGGYERKGHFQYVPLPGGQSAVREPWRMAISYIESAYGKDTPKVLESLGFIERFGDDDVANVLKIAKAAELSPITSSAGRLFDAVAAIMGLCSHNSFEGEAAMALESIAAEDVDDPYPYDLSMGEVCKLDFSYTIYSIVRDVLAKTVQPAVISARFHSTVAEACVALAIKLAMDANIVDVCMSGGVMQNATLCSRIIERVAGSGVTLHLNDIVPPNDAGISLGQAYILRHRIANGLSA